MGTRYFRHYSQDRRPVEEADRKSVIRYVEVGDDLVALRQLKLIHETGRLQRYDGEHPADHFGRLPSEPIDAERSGYEEISAEVFERSWALDGRVLAWPSEAIPRRRLLRRGELLQNIPSSVSRSRFASWQRRP